MKDNVLVKYLLEEASAEEQAAVQRWIGEHEENARYFDHFRRIWEDSRRLAPRVMISEDAAWNRLRQRVQRSEPAPLQPTRVVRLPTLYRIAAAVIVLAVAGSAAWLFLRPPARLVALATQRHTRRDTLPDGSVVTLNKNSTLSFREHFAGNTRTVTLTGEAFFDVAPNAGKPFIIRTGEVAVRVLGTSLNVKTSATATEVIVETGRVEVAKDRHSVQLSAHEKATLVHGEDAPVKASSTDELYRYYSSHTFVCRSTPLYKLVEALNDAYNVDIIIANPNLRQQPLTTTFTATPLDTILNVVGESLNARVTHNGRQIILE